MGKGFRFTKYFQTGIEVEQFTELLQRCISVQFSEMNRRLTEEMINTSDTLYIH